jgi:hypothetical protein
MNWNYIKKNIEPIWIILAIFIFFGISFLIYQNVFAAWLYEQTFDTLNLGDLDGQDSWSGLSGVSPQVQNTAVIQGTQAVKFTPATGNYSRVSRTITSDSSGSYYIWMRHNGWYGNTYHTISSADGNKYFYVNLDGDEFSLNGATSITHVYNQDFWILFNIEYSAAGQIRWRWRYEDAEVWNESDWETWINVYGGAFTPAKIYMTSYNPTGITYGYFDYISSVNPFPSSTSISITYPIDNATSSPINFDWSWTASDFLTPVSSYGVKIVYGLSTTTPEFYQLQQIDHGLSGATTTWSDVLLLNRNLAWNVQYYAKINLYDWCYTSSLCGSQIAESDWINFETLTWTAWFEEAAITKGFNPPYISSTSTESSIACQWDGFFASTTLENIKCQIFAGITQFINYVVLQLKDFIYNNVFAVIINIFPISFYHHFNILTSMVATSTPQAIVLSGSGIFGDKSFTILDASTVPAFEANIGFPLRDWIDRFIYAGCGLVVLITSFLILKKFK